MTKKGVAETLNEWQGLVRLGAFVVGLLGLLGLGSILQNEYWEAKTLTYTILPTYEVQSQAFAGLLIENRGRVNLTDLQIVITDLKTPMLAMEMPGAHDPATVASGGVGDTEARIELARLSEGQSLPIYIVTSEDVSLVPGENLSVSSAETVGVPRMQEYPRGLLEGLIIGYLAAGIFGLLLGGVRTFRYRINQINLSTENDTNSEPL